MKLTTLCYINDHDRYLMLFRNKKQDDPNEGKWIGIGGRVEEGEAPWECMKREVKEETGLTVTRSAFLGVITFISDRWEDEMMFLYRADGFTGEQRSDCLEGTLSWIDKDRIMSLPLWEGDKLFLPELIDGKNDINMKLVYEGETLKEAYRFDAAGEVAIL